MATRIKSLKEELSKKPVSEKAPQEEIQAEPPMEEQAPQEPPQESQTMSNFKQALTYLGPRLIAQLLGGDEAAARTDSLLKGVQQFDESQQKLDLARKQEGRLSQKKDQYEILSLFDEDTKTTRYYKYNVNTGEQVEIGQRGYAPKYIDDPKTGDKFHAQTGDVFDPTHKPGKSISDKTYYQKLNPIQRKRYDILRKEFVTETKSVRAMAEKIEGLSTKQIDLAIKNPAAASQIGAQVATIFEEGRLTDEDVVRYTRRKGLPDRIADNILELSKGTISKDKAKDLKETLKVFKEVLYDIVNNKVTEKANVFAMDYGFDPQETATALYPKFKGSEPQTSKRPDKIKQPQQKQEQQSDKLTPEEMAELRELEAGASRGEF
jgi:hypothetical protein